MTERRSLASTALTAVAAVCLTFLLAPGVPSAAGEAATWTLGEALDRVDTGSKSFRSATADVVLIKSNPVNADATEQTGQVYVRSDGKLRLDLTQPFQRSVLCLPDVVYVHRAEELIVERIKTGKWPDRLEQFMLLGFAPRGSQLKKDYLLTLMGEDELDGTEVILFELTPKQTQMRGVVSRIHLWVSQSTWLPVRQRAFQGSPDSFVEIRYSELAGNADIDDATFKPKWPKGTKTVNR